MALTPFAIAGFDSDLRSVGHCAETQEKSERVTCFVRYRGTKGRAGVTRTSVRAPKRARLCNLCVNGGSTCGADRGAVLKLPMDGFDSSSHRGR